MTASSAHAESAVADDAPRMLLPAEIEALFPADPDIMVSPEGDIRGLNEVKAEARARRAELARKYRQNDSMPVRHGRQRQRC
jgi:hypothetical protein